MKVLSCNKIWYFQNKQKKKRSVIFSENHVLYMKKKNHILHVQNYIYKIFKMINPFSPPLKPFPAQNNTHFLFPTLFARFFTPGFLRYELITE